MSRTVAASGPITQWRTVFFDELKPTKTVSTFSFNIWLFVVDFGPVLLILSLLLCVSAAMVCSESHIFIYTQRLLFLLDSSFMDLVDQPGNCSYCSSLSEVNRSGGPFSEFR